jgi:hypothetical protein
MRLIPGREDEDAQYVVRDEKRSAVEVHIKQHNNVVGEVDDLDAQHGQPELGVACEGTMPRRT